MASLAKETARCTASVGTGSAIRFGNQPGTIKCHAVTAGACWLVVDGTEAPVRLTAGDCIIVPSGHPFTLATSPEVAPVSARNVLAHTRPGEVILPNGGGDFAFAGTRFEVDLRNAGTLLAALPPLIHLHEPEDRDAMRWCLAQLMTELRAARPGAALAARHLAHWMLLQAFRLHLSRQAGGRVGLLYALADRHLGKAIGALHADPARRWTLAELAIEAGLSRSIFAQRFRNQVGETPIGYLTTWRLALARDSLADGREPLARSPKRSATSPRTPSVRPFVASSGARPADMPPMSDPPLLGGLGAPIQKRPNPAGRLLSGAIVQQLDRASVT